MALPTSLAVFSPATFAADVVVVTDSRHPVKTMGGERLIELGETPRIEPSFPRIFQPTLSGQQPSSGNA